MFNCASYASAGVAVDSAAGAFAPFDPICAVATRELTLSTEHAIIFQTRMGDLHRVLVEKRCR